MKSSSENWMRKASHSIVSHAARLKEGANALIICGKHNSSFAGHLMTECYRGEASPHLWVWDENLLSGKHKALAATLPDHTRSLLENSDITIWLTQFENPRSAEVDLGTAVCSFWDKVYEVVRGKPLLLVNLFSQESIERMGMEYGEYLAVFSRAVNVDYRRIRRVGSQVKASLEGTCQVNVTDPNGTDLTFEIENRKVGVEVGTLEDCYTTKRECEVEIPAGEVYVAPVENSAWGRLVVGELRDFGVSKLQLDFERGKIINLRAEEGETEFRGILEGAQGNKDRLAEFGVGINHGMKPIGLRICDEKALGTAHLAIGSNLNLGGVNEASIHIDFNLYTPTVKADGRLVINRGCVASSTAIK